MKDKQFVTQLTSMEEDFTQWYTDIILKTDLVDYSPVKGFMVIKHYGYAIWELIQKYLDDRFKETGHKNCYFPLLIPESLLTKEAEHVEGFAPEVAWVTHGGEKELEERLCVRPTSETIICSMYAKWLKSYRDLPYLYNQWCSVVRWEKTTRPFLRTSEFLWQEGHTLHETYEEAEHETIQMLEIYQELCEKVLAIPVISGQKTENEKFAGAEYTYTIEALMHDGKALQSGTSHFLGQHFTKAFEIKYLDRENKLSFPYHTSWGVSTRLIGGIIMTHGDNRGLVLPPRVAPIQVVLIPIAANKGDVMTTVTSIAAKLKEIGVRVEIDDRNNYTTGYKFNDWEMKGVPIRLEIGPKDIENGQVTLFRRDLLQKNTAKIDHIEDTIENLLDDIHDTLLSKARAMYEEKTSSAKDYDELKRILDEKTGFVKAMWCESSDCEKKIKADTTATIRCIPFIQEQISSHCVCCGKKAEKMVVIAKAY